MRRFLELMLALAGGYALVLAFGGGEEVTEGPSVPVSPVVSLDVTVAKEALSEPSDGFTDYDRSAFEKIQGAYATGDFVAAVGYADTALADPRHSEPFRRWITAQHHALLNSAGWSRLRFGDCSGAVVYLRRAAAINNDKVSAKGLAVCYYKLRNFIAASDQFAKFLEMDSRDGQMRLLYADVLESLGDYPRAVQVLQDTPDAELAQEVQVAVRERLAAMKKKSEESWHQKEEFTRHFSIRYRIGDHEDLISFVARTLEDALDRWISDYDFLPPRVPIEVSLYPASVFGDLVVGGPAWAEGLFDGRLRIPIQDEVIESGDFTRLQQILEHELVHAMFFVRSGGRPMPSWFDEGMAQRLVCADACLPFRFGPSPGDFLQPPSFETRYTTLSALEAGRAYQQSLYLILTIERHFGADVLRRLVAGVRTTSALDSDGVLKPIAKTFIELVGQAKTNWGRREDYGD